jgi:hypothetical protein
MFVVFVVSGCRQMTYYKANPEYPGETVIPGASKKMTSGRIWVSGIRPEEDIYGRLAEISQERDFIIDGYYRNPEITRSVDLEVVFEIIPYVLPVMMPVVKTSTSGDVHVQIKGVEIDGKVAYVIPRYNAKYPLKKITINRSDMQPPTLLVEKESSEAEGKNGIYAAITLRYADLEVHDKEKCAGKSSLVLSPVEISKNYGRSDSVFSEGFWGQAEYRYLNDSEFKLHFDLSESEVCLLPIDRSV